MGLFGKSKEEKERRELKGEVDKLMNSYSKGKIDGDTYFKDMMKLTIIAMVVNNYFALRAADAEIIINTNTLKTREESVRLTKNRVDAGLVSPIDFHQAMWLLASAQQEEADFRRQRAIA